MKIDATYKLLQLNYETSQFETGPSPTCNFELEDSSFNAGTLNLATNDILCNNAAESNLRYNIEQFEQHATSFKLQNKFASISSPSTLTDDVFSIKLAPTNNLIALKEDKISSITSLLALSDDISSLNLTPPNNLIALKQNQFSSMTIPLTLTDDILSANLTPTNNSTDF